MPMNQEVIPGGGGGGGILARICPNKVPAVHMEKSISPLFPGSRGDVVANVWCIMWKKKKTINKIYISAHVLLNLLNELGKSDKMRGWPSILLLFRNEFNRFNKTGARM